MTEFKCNRNCNNKLCRKSVNTDEEFLSRLQGYLLNSFEKSIADQFGLEVMKSLKGVEEWDCQAVEKAVQGFEVQGDFELGMPIEKSFEQTDGSLIIFGKASGPDEDLDGEVVDQTALGKLFTQYMDNPVIKFMHGRDYIKHAIGKCLEEFKYPDTGVIYKSAFTEEGPFLVGMLSSASDVEPVRKKVKEGILKGLSIGGKVGKKVKGFDKELGKFTVRVIPRAWTETSVVDTPAYRKATFGVLMKAVNGRKLNEEKKMEGQKGTADILKISADEKINLFMKVARLDLQMDELEKGVGMFRWMRKDKSKKHGKKIRRK